MSKHVMRYVIKTEYFFSVDADSKEEAVDKFDEALDFIEGDGMFDKLKGESYDAYYEHYDEPVGAYTKVYNVDKLTNIN